MTSNIISKVTSRLSIDSSTNPEKISNSTKYGDDDVSSKRRKDSKCNENNEDDYVYDTLFRRHLSSDSASNAEHMNLNSNLINNDKANQSTCSTDDFNGGPVSTSITTFHSSNEQIDDLNQSITSHPSDSSFGFHNTFSVLEKQLCLNKQPKLNQKQIEYLLLKNNDAVVKNPIYIDIPINDEWCLRAVSGQANSSLQDTDEDECPSLFELEFEAMQRVKELLADKETGLNDWFVESPSIAMDQSENSQISINTSLIEDFYQQDGGDYSEYVYHVAKSKEGRIYLRVVRSLLVDKGKQQSNFNIIFFLFNLIFASINIIEDK